MSDVPTSAHDDEADAVRSSEVMPPESGAEQPAIEHVEPTPTSAEPAPELIEPAEPVAETGAVASAVADPLVDDHPVVVHEAGATGETIAAGQAAVAPLAAVSAVPARQLVYVQPDLPPKRRGNRGIGVLLAVVGAAIFAGLYALVSAFIIDVQDGKLFGDRFTLFVGSVYFWVPLVVFTVGLILMVLLLNRAGWWAHVFGSLILAIAVYFGMIGVLLFIANVIHVATPQVVTYASLAVDPWVIASAVVAREVSIWTGLGIAARGRRVKARNVIARDNFEREQEAKSAQHAGTAGV